MKKLFTTVAFLAGFAAPAFAQECTLWGQYHGSNGDIFDEDPSLQCTATAATGDGFYGNIWIASDFKGGWMGGSDTVTDFGDEVDVTVGKFGEISGLNYDVGASLFIMDHPTPDNGDVVQLYSVLSDEFDVGTGTLVPFIKYEYYLPTNGNLPLDGSMIRVGADYNSALADGWSYSVGCEIFYDDGAFGYQAGTLYFARAEIAYEFKDSVFGRPVKVAGVIKASAPLSGAGPRDDHQTFGMSIRLK